MVALLMIALGMAMPAALAEVQTPAKPTSLPGTQATPSSPSESAFSLSQWADLMQAPAGSVRFTETKYLAALEQPIEISGVLRFEPPDRLLRVNRTDPPEQFQIDGNRMDIFRDGRRARTVHLNRFPEARAFLAAYRATLNGDLAGLRQYYEVELSGQSSDWRMDLSPIDPDLVEHVERMVLLGKGERLYCFEVYEVSGDHSRMLIEPMEAPSASAEADAN